MFVLSAGMSPHALRAPEVVVIVTEKTGIKDKDSKLSHYKPLTESAKLTRTAILIPNYLITKHCNLYLITNYM